MNILYAKSFQKQLRKLSGKIQHQFYDRLELFLSLPHSPQLKDLALKGDLVGKRSFSVSGDYRVIYKFLDEENLKLISIGTHSQLY